MSVDIFTKQTPLSALVTFRQVVHLNSFGESLEFVGGELNGGRALRDEGHDGDAGVSSNHGAVHVGGVQSLLLGYTIQFV